MPQTGQPSLKERLNSPVTMWVIVIIGIVLSFTLVPNREFFHRNPFTIGLFTVAVVNWIYLFFGAILINKTAPRSVAEVNQLVTTGIYAKVRHPIYSADIILAWGLFLIFPTLKVLLSVVWLTFVMIFWMKIEESGLTHKFGDEYTRYKAHTPMFIPRYFR